MQLRQQSKVSLAQFNLEFMQLAFKAKEEENYALLKSRYLLAIRLDLTNRIVTVELLDSCTIQEMQA